MNEEAIHLPAPMEKNEAAAFLKIYKGFSSDNNRKDQLDQIAARASLEKYRLPFFYGLITFAGYFLMNIGLTYNDNAIAIDFAKANATGIFFMQVKAREQHIVSLLHQTH